MSEKTINLNGKTILVKETRSEYSRHFKTNCPLTLEEGMQVQEKLGFASAGYGFDSFRSSKECAVWSCGLSCD